ncbi:MAG: GNAT family N-acetyltransferase [Phycisphaerales bacterium]|nr:GNAT family N-acetyltransferase [Phycisphaerales bacterium]
MSLDYAVLSSDAQVSQYARVLSHSFGRTEEEAAKWIGRYDRRDVRVLSDQASGTVVAGLIVLPMGQYFGGRSVPKWGIAAVGVAPEARGHGAATELMSRIVVEMHERGIPISGLYPATQALYRRAGYEQGGARFEIRMPLCRIDSRRRDLAVRAADEKDHGRVRGLYAKVAAHCDGALDRGDMQWDRILRPPPSRVDPARAFVAVGVGGEVEGWVYLMQALGAPRGKHEVVVHDIGFTSRDVGLRLLAFLAGYATMGTDLVMYGGSSSPILMLLGEQPFSFAFGDYWMTRITAIGPALGARGYPHGLAGSLAFEVEDDVVPGNTGVWELHVEGGTGRAERATSAGRHLVVRADIRGFATMFTGFQSPWALSRLGLIQGSDEALAMAGAMFGGHAPAMADFY